MVIVHTRSFSVRTRGKGLYLLTGKIDDSLRESRVRDGVTTVFVRHTSASLVIYENADPSAQTDLLAYFARLAPEDEPYFVHNAEGPDDMPAHLRSVLTRTSESVPVSDGRLLLGTWQGVYLFEHRDAPHTREIVVTVIGV